jgi:hypothetical protein
LQAGQTDQQPLSYRLGPPSGNDLAKSKTELSIPHFYENTLLAAEKPIQINSLRVHIFTDKISQARQ